MLNRKYFNFFQLLVAGALEVGKTSLIHRFTDDYFTLNNINGIDFKLKIIKIKEKPIKLKIWDLVDIHIKETRKTLIASFFYMI